MSRSQLAVLAVVIIIAFGACEPAKGPAEYGAELAACTAAAKARQVQGATTLEQGCQESIACENAVRARQSPPRPARDPSAGCK